MVSNPATPLQIGVINPFALVELKLGRKINWQNIADPRRLLEQVLGKPYHQLFDPKNGSPLYAGLKNDAERKVMVRDETDPIFTARTPEEALVSVLQRTGKVSKRSEEAREEQEEREELVLRQGIERLLSEVATKRSDAALKVEKLSQIRRELIQNRRYDVLPPSIDIFKFLLDGFDWIDPGHFFTDSARPIDVIQGSLGDCYFVAALASVAWTHPFTIAQRTRPIDVSGQFATPGAVDLVLFWNESTNQWDRIEVTELLPMQPPSDGYIYARSDDPTEIWSAIYEKAYAMWRTGDTDNYPNYSPITGGDPAAALTALTGLPRSYYPTNGVAPYDIWQTVRSHSLSFKTFDPMVAWTYGSDNDAPTPINYGNAHIVANHAYSILGWDYDESTGDEYIVLRNPWGSTEAILDVEGGSWYAYDGSFWRPTPLGSQGIFALRADIFQQYYAGYGVVTGADTIPEF